MAPKAIRVPAAKGARRLFVYDLISRAGTLDMDTVYADHGITSSIVRLAVKDLAEAGLVKVERDRYVRKAR